jgi:hypothetical protein
MLAMADQKLQAEYGSATGEEREELVTDSSAYVEPACYKKRVSERRVTFRDRDTHTSRRLNSPPPPFVVPKVPSSQYNRKVTVVNIFDRVSPSIRVSVVTSFPAANVSRFGRER